MKTKKLITHNGSFHTDDVFACATISLMLKKDKQTFEIIRARDKEIIKNGDYVFDVGGIYDEKNNRFDHHQKGGAGNKAFSEVKIEYASFGLVWKKFGIEICGTQEIVDFIDKKLVSPIDAGDNGFDLVENKYDVSPYQIQYFFSSMAPTWREKNISNDAMFLESVEIAEKVLLREIVHARDFMLAKESMVEIYKNTKDKSVLIFNENYPSAELFHNFPETFFVIYPRTADDTWGVKAIREDLKSFKNRKDFPASWSGLKDEELRKITGVSDAVFCHRALFLAVAKSKEGATRLAELALLEPNN